MAADLSPGAHGPGATPSGCRHCGVVTEIRTLADRYRKAGKDADTLGQKWDGIQTAMFLDTLADTLTRGES